MGKESLFALSGFSFFSPSCAKSRSIIGEDSADKNTPDSWSASVFRVIQTSGRRGIMRTPTRFDITTADVIGNVLRFKEGYLNKSHYLYAEAVFTSEGKKTQEYKKWVCGEKRVNDKGETDRRGERARCKMVSDRDEKQRRRGGGLRRYDNRFTTGPNQFPFLTSSGPADD